MRLPMAVLDRVTLQKGRSTRYTTSYTLREGCEAGGALQSCLLDTGSQGFRNGTRNARRVRGTCRQTVLDGPGIQPIWFGSGSFRARDQQRLTSSARRQTRGCGAALVIPPQCDLRSQHVPERPPESDCRLCWFGFGKRWWIARENM